MFARIAIVFCVVVVVLDMRIATESSSDEIRESFSRFQLSLKSYLDTDWLSIMDDELKEGSKAALIKFRIHLLQYRFLPPHFIKDESPSLFLSLDDEVLGVALGKIVDAADSVSWREVYVPWPSADISSLNHMLNLLQSIQVRNSTAEPAAGVVKFAVKVRREDPGLHEEITDQQGAAARSLCAMVGFLHGSFWPIRRSRAVIDAVALNPSPFLSSRVFQFLLEVLKLSSS